MGIAVGYEIKGTAFGASAVTRFKDRIDSMVGFSINGTTVIDSSQNATFTGTATFSGATYAKELIPGSGKVVLTGGTTSTLSGAQLCSGSSYFEWIPTANGTLTLPSAAASTCLSANGNYRDIFYKDNSTAFTTLFAAGASSTIVVVNATSTDGSATTTLNAGAIAKLTFLLSSSTDPTSGMTVFVQKFR